MRTGTVREHRERRALDQVKFSVRKGETCQLAYDHDFAQCRCQSTHTVLSIPCLIVAKGSKSPQYYRCMVCNTSWPALPAIDRSRVSSQRSPKKAHR